MIARRVAAISQRELGERVGVKQQQVARWEATRYRTASLERVDSAARALALDVPLELPLAAETSAAYGAPDRATTAVRDLGDIVACIRANGAEFRDRYRIDRIGVFGSFVHGEQTPDSDVDLLVETKDPGGFRFISAAGFAESALGRRVDFIQPDSLKDGLRERVLKDVVYVWSA
ncbi:MAG: nucleotidyltransferase domain-containing protein [Coriobacteriia bacterium]|nr:nucleotidyltransferase domain-containing protein [Coriobacteriia bacterium]